MKKVTLMLILAVSAIMIAGCDTTGDILKTSESTRAQYTCQDTDNGRTYDLAGEVSGNIGRKGTYTYTDYCEDWRHVREYYCGGSTPLNERYTCMNGCENGRCI